MRLKPKGSFSDRGLFAEQTRARKAKFRISSGWPVLDIQTTSKHENVKELK